MILKPFFFQLYYFLPFLSLCVCVCVCVQLRIGFLFCYLFLAKVNLNCRPYESQRITLRMLNIPKLSMLNRTLIANSSWVQAQILSFMDPETQFIYCWQNSQVLGDCFTLTTLAKDSHKQRSNLLICSWIYWDNAHWPFAQGIPSAWAHLSKNQIIDERNLKKGGHILEFYSLIFSK